MRIDERFNMERDGREGVGMICKSIINNSNSLSLMTNTTSNDEMDPKEQRE